MNSILKLLVQQSWKSNIILILQWMDGWMDTEMLLPYIKLILSNYILYFSSQHIFDSCDCFEIVRLTTILEHSWMWDYLNALASGDVWIIIQPFFRRLEPQAAAVVSRRRRRNRRKVKMRWRRRSSGDIMGRNQKTRKMWREWHPLENLSNQRWTSSHTLPMCFTCTTHTCAHTFTYKTHTHLHITHVCL